MFIKQWNKNEKNAFYIIIIIFIVFLFFRGLSGIFHLDDSSEYLGVAKNIRNLSFFNTQSSIISPTKRPIVYPLFLTLFYSFPIIVSVFFQTLFGVFTFFLIFKIIKKIGVEIKKSYLWFLIFTPSIFIYTQLIVSEWLVMFFITLLFWVLIQKWSTKNFAYIQIITILLAFTKPIFYPLIYLNFIFFTIYFLKKKTFNFWLFIPIIVLQFYMTFNAVKTGYRHFSSIENINLINYNLYYFKCKTESKTKANLWLDSVYNSAYEKKNFEEKNKYLHEIATKEIKKHFFQYSYYHFYTSIRGVFDPGRFDLMTFFKREDGEQGFLEILNTNKSALDLLKNKFAFIYVFLVPIFLINLIKWFYFLKYLLIKKLDFKVYYIISILACYILITGPVNSSRYMMPFQGIIIIFAISGLNLKEKKCKKLKSH